MSNQNFRQLFTSILQFRGHDATFFSRVITPWMINQGIQERDWLQSLVEQHPDPTVPLDSSHKWRLYALSRVFDLLIPSFSPPVENPKARPPRLSAYDFERFLQQLGLTAIFPKEFHPFYCEITGVEQSEDDQFVPLLLDTKWPAAKLGHWMFYRSGCVVGASKDHITKEIAEQSTLYWTYLRYDRPVRDLSHGWGSQSQWGTDWRQDCEFEGRFHYNIMHPEEVHRIDDQLTADELIELVRYRSFVRTQKDSDGDFWPYDFEFSEPSDRAEG